MPRGKVTCPRCPDVEELNWNLKLALSYSKVLNRINPRPESLEKPLHSLSLKLFTCKRQRMWFLRPFRLQQLYWVAQGTGQQALQCSFLLRPGFFYVSTVDMWSWRVLCYGLSFTLQQQPRPLPIRRQSHPFLELWQLNMSPDIAKRPLGSNLVPPILLPCTENPCTKVTPHRPHYTSLQRFWWSAFSGSEVPVLTGNNITN